MKTVKVNVKIRKITLHSDIDTEDGDKKVWVVSARMEDNKGIPLLTTSDKAKAEKHFKDVVNCFDYLQTR